MTKRTITQTTPYDSPGTLDSLWCQNCRWHSDEVTSNGGTKYRWGRFKSAIFDNYLAISQKRCKIGTYFLRKA